MGARDHGNALGGAAAAEETLDIGLVSLTEQACRGCGVVVRLGLGSGGLLGTAHRHVADEHVDPSTGEGAGGKRQCACGHDRMGLFKRNGGDERSGGHHDTCAAGETGGDGTRASALRSHLDTPSTHPTRHKGMRDEPYTASL